MDETARVVDWSDRDRALHKKLKQLYILKLSEWLDLNKGKLHHHKWHVGREMFKWFYDQGLLTPAEVDQLNQKMHRPTKKPDIEFYRIVWKESGRASAEVAAICTAPHMGPGGGAKQIKIETDDEVASPVEPTTGSLDANSQLNLGTGGWVYAYGFEIDLRRSKQLDEAPLLKVGFTTGDYKARVLRQCKGTAVPDKVVVVRAYQVQDAHRVEQRAHAILKQRGLHHAPAGGQEWFRVHPEQLDEIIREAV